MRLPLTGGCQCGAVRYEIRAQPLTVYACHCTECQRQSASAFSLSLVVARDAVVIIAGTPKQWRRVIEGTRAIGCVFCGECGVRLLHNPERNPQVSIDDTSWLEPVGHVWTRSAQSWFEIPDDGVNYDGQPPDQSRLIEAWRARQAAK